jgi:hypothetical protein
MPADFEILLLQTKKDGGAFFKDESVSSVLM